MEFQDRASPFSFCWGLCGLQVASQWQEQFQNRPYGKTETRNRGGDFLRNNLQVPISSFPVLPMGPILHNFQSPNTWALGELIPYPTTTMREPQKRIRHFCGVDCIKKINDNKCLGGCGEKYLLPTVEGSSYYGSVCGRLSKKLKIELSYKPVMTLLHTPSTDYTSYYRDTAHPCFVVAQFIRARK